MSRFRAKVMMECFLSSGHLAHERLNTSEQKCQKSQGNSPLCHKSFNTIWGIDKFGEKGIPIGK